MTLTLFTLAACWPGGGSVSQGTTATSDDDTTETTDTTDTTDTMSMVPECTPSPENECDLFCPECGVPAPLSERKVFRRDCQSRRNCPRP